jgi:hypothetical protein
VLDKLLYHVLEMPNGMEHLVLVKPKELVFLDQHGMELHVLVFNLELVHLVILKQEILVLVQQELFVQQV